MHPVFYMFSFWNFAAAVVAVVLREGRYVDVVRASSFLVFVATSLYIVLHAHTTPPWIGGVQKQFYETFFSWSRGWDLHPVVWFLFDLVVHAAPLLVLGLAVHPSSYFIAGALFVLWYLLLRNRYEDIYPHTTRKETEQIIFPLLFFLTSFAALWTRFPERIS